MSGLPRFSFADAIAAFDAWGANCGPGALEQKHYTNPTLMFAALKSIGARYYTHGILTGGLAGRDWPRFGLCRVQWEGPWTAPGVPIRARYRHTHWVGSWAKSNDNIGVFDINCMNNGTGWTALHDWATTLVPWLLKEAVPRANGKWHLTHAIEVSREGAAT